MNPRLVGALFLLAGIGFCYWQIWLPLQAARQHAPEVSYESKGQFLGVICTLLGITKLAFGDKLDWQNQNFRRDWRYWVMVVAGVGLAIGMDVWMKNELGKYGYSVR